jgi:NADH:ubiquinone oxidoreductase subunit K
VDVVWFVVLSAFIFCIGAAGVLSRRNPLVVLLSLELMLNAGNLALIAFARMHGGDADGQVFALIVMVIAACEVVIGLGIIVAMYRRRLPIDVDEMSELRG